jgi:hypothetical protein
VALDLEKSQTSFEQRLKDTIIAMETEKERCDSWFRKREEEMYEYKIKFTGQIDSLEKSFKSTIEAL